MQNRVIIEQVKPEIDGGIYFVKRTIGESVDVTANIFGDGHDVIRASLLYRVSDAKNWQEVFMTALPNDEWAASFTPDKTGMYEYKIIAWIDNLMTWHKGFKKKYDDGQHIDVELAMGVNFLKQNAENYSKTEAKDMLAYAKILDNKKDYLKAVQTVITEDFAKMVQDFPLKNHVTTYDHNLRVKVERTLAGFSAWYEFFPRSATDNVNRHGTFKDVIKQLPRVAEFGFDILYLPPVHPVGEINRKGKNNSVTAKAGEPGSPWAIGSRHGGHKAIEPALGTITDYVNLIKEAKKLGIEIALDLALQCAPDHPYIKEHPNWFVWRPDGTIAYAENPPKKYQDIVPLNFECDDWKNLWNELESIFEFWIEKGVTVYRVDNPHTKPIPFWEWCIAEVHKKYPDVIFLAEAFTRPKIMGSLGKIGYTQSYSYFTWRVTKAELTEYMTELTQTESKEYYRPNFWPNTPDILPYHLHNRNSNAFYLRLALAATMSSNYGVYGPVYEFCDNESFHGKEEYMNSEKYEIQLHDWNARNRITDLMTLLNKIRKANTALQSTWNIHFTPTTNDKLISYIKISENTVDAGNPANGGKGPKNIIWCIANLDTENTQAGDVGVPKELLDIKGRANISVQDFITGETYSWKDDWNFVELNPYKSPIHIFKVTVFE
jgi:starch synthase (maltosyl-transferring)